MTIAARMIAASLLGLVCAMPEIGLGEEPTPHHPAKAPPTAPRMKPLEMKTVVKVPVATAQTLKPPKPLVATAVVPKTTPVPVGQRSIIFVGGKPADGKGALNPQPIPPGHGGPGDPIAGAKKIGEN
jgi:hypothetical protein